MTRRAANPSGTKPLAKSREIASGCHAPGDPEVISKDGPGTPCRGRLLEHQAGLILGIALRMGLRMAVRAAAENSEPARFDIRPCVDRGGGESELQELAHGCGSRRHAMFEPEVIAASSSGDSMTWSRSARRSFMINHPK
ncbi:hypothetical protein IVA75_14370 [Bradyrhizobium sp. 134]|nr:hypothetical protein [Bradyrhizobium sp. 134]